jgi:hypothetical protein
MTGVSERQSRGPRENRRASSPASTGERAAIHQLFAAKIAAARVYAADHHQLAAIVAALRSEERAALSALQDRQAAEARQRRDARPRASYARRPRPWWPYRRRKKGGAEVAAPSK